MSQYYGFEDVWLDKSMYENAERLYYEEHAKSNDLHITQFMTNIYNQLLPKFRICEFAIISLFVHILITLAVFDIYYASPICQGLTPHRAKDVVLAKRVVFISSNGLRAASFYHEDMDRTAPFLTAKIRSNVSSWGVSHAKAPTESRPGLLALLGGFNEDVSAIAKGWVHNLVPFDSVVNQSTNAWCWGTHSQMDLLNDHKLKHIHTQYFDWSLQQMERDNWVMNQTIDFLQRHEQEHCTDICAQGNVFIMLLGGVDNACHDIDSENCNLTVINVDQVVRKLVSTFDQFFKDNKTAYIFTSGHGKTNKGAHGGRSILETEIPVVAWGAGISQRNVSEDIEQIDTAPLISSLIGINFPVNSMGIAPVNYLNASLHQKAQIMYTNALQMSEQFHAKYSHLKGNSLSWLFRPFAKLPEHQFVQLMNKLENLSTTKEYEVLIAECHGAIKLMKEGMHFYYRQHQILLLPFITFGFIGWIIYVLISIQDLNTVEYDKCKQDIQEYTQTYRNIHGEVLALFFILCTAPFATSVSIKDYLYMVFPIFTWCMVLGNYKNGLVTVAILSTFTWKDLIVTMLNYTYQLGLLVLTFFQTLFLTLLFTNLAFLEVLNKQYRSSLWIFGVFALGLCPLLTPLKPFTITCQITALLLWGCYGYVLHVKMPNSQDKQILTFQFVLLICTFGNILLVEIFIKYSVALFCNRLMSWIIIGATLVCPLLTSRNLQNRLISCTVALVTPYTMMTVGYESLFMFFFAQQMLRWIPVEHKRKRMTCPDFLSLKSYETVKITLEEHTDMHTVKLCFCLLAFLALSYFGTGNVPSINGLGWNWKRCLVWKYYPYEPWLSYFKLTIPLLLVVCAFHGVKLISEVQIRNTFLMISLFCDIMVLPFFYLIKNEGSWLEMGSSLAQFLIVNFAPFVVVLLYGVTLLLATKSIPLFTAVRMVKSMRSQQV